MWGWVGGATVLALATRLLPWGDAVPVGRRLAPVLLFLVSVTVLAELAEAAQLFDVAASYAARLARGHTGALFLLVAVLATGTTVLLGLDTTAVLLTPVVLSTTARLDLPPMPFALLTVWLANTASLLLPVSNLTNLLALDRLELDPHAFATRMWAPAAAAVVATVALVGLRHRRLLRVRYPAPAAVQVADRVLLVTAATACLGIVPALLAGGDPTVVVTAAALGLLAVVAVRRPAALRAGLVPWRLAVSVLGLALLVQTALGLGVGRLVDTGLGEGSGPVDLLRVAGVGALVSNLVNNLPAYLLLEPYAAGDDSRVLGLLLGTNAGPMVLLWGSLATLLWRERLRARGLEVSARAFAAFGVVGVPVVLLASTLALALAS